MLSSSAWTLLYATDKRLKAYSFVPTPILQCTVLT